MKAIGVATLSGPLDIGGGGCKKSQLMRDPGSHTLTSNSVEWHDMYSTVHVLADDISLTFPNSAPRILV